MMDSKVLAYLYEFMMPPAMFYKLFNNNPYFSFIHFTTLAKLILFKPMPNWLQLNIIRSNLNFLQKAVESICCVYFIPINADICHDLFCGIFK